VPGFHSVVIDAMLLRLEDLDEALKGSQELRSVSRPHLVAEADGVDHRTRGIWRLLVPLDRLEQHAHVGSGDSVSLIDGADGGGELAEFVALSDEGLLASVFHSFTNLEGAPSHNGLVMWMNPRLRVQPT
jgi:hypothetical protein